jgi:hypothetical protein
MKAVLLCTLGAILLPVALGYALVGILYTATVITRYKPK